MVKNPPAVAGDVEDASLIPGSGRSPGGGHSYPLQCSCLENPMDRRAWWAAVHGVTKSWARLMTKQQQCREKPSSSLLGILPVSCLYYSHITCLVSKCVAASPYNKRFSETSAEYPTV